MDNVVLFVKSWMPLFKIKNIIKEETGYNNPYFNILRYNDKFTNKSFVIVPRDVSEKLLKLEVDGVEFHEPKYHDITFDPEYRGLYVIASKRDNLPLLRRRILDILYDLDCFGLIDMKQCFLSKGNRLFVNSSDEDVKLIYSFINGASYSGKRYIRVSYLKKREEGEEELAEDLM